MCKAVWLLLCDPGRDFLGRGRRSLSQLQPQRGQPHSAPPPARGAATAPSAGELQQLVDTLQNDHAAGKAGSATSGADRGAASHRAPEIGGGGSARALVQPDRRLHRRDSGRRRNGRGCAAVDPLGARANAQSRPRASAGRARPQALVLVFGGAAAAEAALRWVIARTRPKFPVRRRDTRAIKALFALLALILDLVPILVFAAIVYGAVAMALEFIDPDRHHDVGPCRGDDRGAADPVSRTRGSDPARRGHFVPAARRRDAQLSLHLGQTLHVLGRLRLCGA